MVGLLNFLSKEQKEKIQNTETSSLDKKNSEIEELTQKFIKQGISEEKAKAEAEITLFKPKPLPQIQMQNTNVTAGKRIKIFFFISEDKLKQLDEKFRVLEQNGELIISTASTDKFIEKVLG